MELHRTEQGFALYKEKDCIGECTLSPAPKGAQFAALCTFAISVGQSFRMSVSTATFSARTRMNSNNGNTDTKESLFSGAVHTKRGIL